MSSYDAETLARQLGQLGRDLEESVETLAGLELESVEAEGRFRTRENAFGDALDRAFLDADGGVEARKATARLVTGSYRLDLHVASLDWSRAKAAVRCQQASLTALHKRIEIGRSLLSREKALLTLDPS
jgi:hypothetical protein